MAFLLDSSGSRSNAGEANYQIMKDFIKRIVESFTIGENDTAVAVATFSSLSKFNVRFNFTQYFTTPEIVTAIENIPYDNGLSTYTGKALERLKRELLPSARPNVPHLLIVLSDSEAHDDVKSPAQELRKMDVHIIAVGIGDADRDQLKDIASDPDSENVFTSTFDSVLTVTDSILENVCKGE